MEIGNENYTALFHVILFIFALWIIATTRFGNKDE
jgi:hypothetical protein